MKKTIIYIMTLTLFILFPITTRALTKINFVEASNGEINTTLHFEEGFVGGIDLKINIDGNVNVKNIEFNNKIKENGYTVDYEYNKDKNLLEIKITSGGIGASHNLLNEKKEFALGKIVFDTVSKENVNYSFNINSLSFVNNNWETQKIEKQHLTLGDINNFTYVVKKESETSKNEEKVEDNDMQNSNESSENNVSNDTTLNADNKKDKNNNNDVEKNDNVLDEKEDTDLKDEENKETNNNNQNELSNSNLIYWFLGFILLAIMITIIVVIIKRNKIQNR